MDDSGCTEQEWPGPSRAALAPGASRAEDASSGDWGLVLGISEPEERRRLYRARAEGDRAGRRTSGVDFRGHDLRRTAASLMVGAGVPRLVVSKILNHVETGVTAVYDRHSYDLRSARRSTSGASGWSRSSVADVRARCWRLLPARSLLVRSRVDYVLGTRSRRLPNDVNPKFERELVRTHRYSCASRSDTAPAMARPAF